MKRIMTIAALGATLGLALAACDRKEQATSFTMNADQGDATLNGATGQVSIDTPVFKGTFKLPKVSLTAENFDVGGVNLYPGSEIRDVNVDASGGADGKVSVNFTSPASPAKVRDWFQQQFAAHDTDVQREGNALIGQVEDKPFRIELAPDGDTASGRVTIG